MSGTDRAHRALDGMEVAIAWRDALALWETRVDLSPPIPLSRSGGDRWQGNDPLAFIDMEKRQVFVNLPLLSRIGAADSLMAVLAHEVGHHLHFPHTLGIAAQLEVLLDALMPNTQAPFINLFLDLRVNEVVGRTHATQLIEVYRGFNRETPLSSPLFGFYLAIYEELWALPEGTLVPVETRAAFEKQFPGFTGDARMACQTLYALDGLLLQFAYFVSRASRYVEPNGGAKGKAQVPLAGDVSSADPDDLSRLIEGSQAVDDALAEAGARGFIDVKGGQRTKGADPFQRLGRLAGAPGRERGPFVEQVVSQLYKRLVDRHLVKLPTSVGPVPEPYLPTLAEAWDVSDSPREIDWTLSVLAKGPLAALEPLKREREADPPVVEPGETVALELYLDTSGSMPHPSAAVNAMTLAAQILAASAIRRLGRVRGFIYSVEFMETGWMYGEERARRQLLHYVGGGTSFPFQRCLVSARADPDLLRVVISDWDFLSNCKEQGAMERFTEAVGKSRLFVALLSLPGLSLAEAKRRLGPIASHPKFRLGIVSDAADLPQAAAALTRALWG